MLWPTYDLSRTSVIPTYNRWQSNHAVHDYYLGCCEEVQHLTLTLSNTHHVWFKQEQSQKSCDMRMPIQARQSTWWELASYWHFESVGLADKQVGPTDQTNRIDRPFGIEEVALDNWPTWKCMAKSHSQL